MNIQDTTSRSLPSFCIKLVVIWLAQIDQIAAPMREEIKLAPTSLPSGPNADGQLRGESGDVFTPPNLAFKNSRSLPFPSQPTSPELVKIRAMVPAGACCKSRSSSASSPSSYDPTSYGKSRASACLNGTRGCLSDGLVRHPKRGIWRTSGRLTEKA